jgi:hypothetical protein
MDHQFSDADYLSGVVFRDKIAVSQINEIHRILSQISLPLGKRFTIRPYPKPDNSTPPLHRISDIIQVQHWTIF